MIGYDCANNVTAQLSIANIQGELMISAPDAKTARDEANFCNVSEGVNYGFGMLGNKTTIMAKDSAKNKMINNNDFASFANKKLRNGLPLYLDNHNSQGEGESFQDICASMTATQFDDLNSTDGGGGNKADDFLGRMYNGCKQSLVTQPGLLGLNVCNNSMSLFCEPASNTVTTVGHAKSVLVPPQDVWPVYQAAAVHNSSGESNANHPNSSHFGPPHWLQSIRGDHGQPRSTTTPTASTTIVFKPSPTTTTRPTKRKCLFKRAFSEEDKLQLREQQQCVANLATNGLMCCVMPLCSLISNITSILLTHSRAAPLRPQLDAVVEETEEEIFAPTLLPKNSQHCRGCAFSVNTKLENAQIQYQQQLQTTLQPSSISYHYCQSSPSTSPKNSIFTNVDNSTVSSSLPLPPAFAVTNSKTISQINNTRNNNSSIGGNTNSIQNPISLPLPPYCGCGCSGSIAPSFNQDNHHLSPSHKHYEKDNEEEEPIYYIIATTHRKRNTTNFPQNSYGLTAKNAHDVADDFTEILPPSCVLSPALTPQSHLQVQLLNSQPLIQQSNSEKDYNTSASNITPIENLKIDTYQSGYNNNANTHGSQTKKPSDWKNWIDKIFAEVQNEMQEYCQAPTIPHYLLLENRKRKILETLPQMSLGYNFSTNSSCSSTSSLSASPQSSWLSPISTFDSISSENELQKQTAALKSESTNTPPVPKRAKKYSLCTLSHEELVERKKEQNRIAAQRYRSKRTQTLEEGRQEIIHLESLNTKIRDEAEKLFVEITKLKIMLGLASK